MSQFFSMEKIPGQKVDPVLLGIILLMVGVGLSLLFSASHFAAQRLLGNPLSFVLRQSMWAAIGLVGAWVVSRMTVATWRKIVPFLLLASLILMIMTFIPLFGRELMGARRWILIGGFSFQPSEMVKMTLILYFANLFAKKEGQLEDLKNSLLPPFIVLSVFSFLILMQNDYSTAAFVFLIGFICFFLAGVKLRYLIPALLGSSILGGLVLFSRSYRVERLMAFLDPGADPSGAGYQILSAKRALSEGGMWGVGIGAGTRKLGGIPEVQSDFIFAVLGEEMGFLGVLLMFLLFGLLLWKGVSIAMKTQDRFTFLLASGISILISLQFLINVGVVSGVLPATGIPLPYFSSGGSALFINLLMAGFLLGLSRKSDEGVNR